jgi:hypothetical protein
MAFDKIRTHAFRDRMFHILWRRWRRSPDEIPGSNVGRCDHRETPQPQMHVYPSKDDLELLIAVTHEAVHACFSDISNDAVDEFDSDYGRLLRRMGIEVKFHGR